MPNFKEFIKGFEEKPISNPKPQEMPKQEATKPQPKEQPQQGRMVYYQGKEMPFEEAKARSMGSYSIPKGYKPSEKEKQYMEKAAEYEVEEDDAFARWDHETDPDKKAELRKNMDNLGKEANAFLRELDKEPIDQPNPQPKQGSFEQAFGDNQPREEFSQEDKAALVATYGAFPEEGIVARKLPNGNYLTNILSGADTEPEEVDEATLSKVFDELRGEKGFEEIINEWRENPNLIRERRNVQ